MVDLQTDVHEVLGWLASLAPTRLTGTAQEKAVQEAIARRLEGSGYAATWQSFRFPRHIYGSLALHFGLALALIPVGASWPVPAALGHLVVAGSFFSEAVLRRHVLRRLWPAVATQNVLLTRAATRELRRRIVLLAHADSAFTGLMFHPPILRAIAKPPPSFLPFLKKQLFLPFVCTLVLAVFGLLRPWYELPWGAVCALSIPLALVFALNADIVLRNRVVPGAADNLSGCAAQVVLAEAFAGKTPPDIELIFVFTGAEEAGTGGAAHLARTAGWDPSITEVIVLDTLSNGKLFLLEEGELFRVPMPPELRQEARQAAAEEGEPIPEDYAVPAGATDALPFLVCGYRALALTCIDPEQHAPRNYHHPSDTADRVDPEQLRASTRVARRLLERLCAPGTGGTQDERARSL